MSLPNKDEVEGKLDQAKGAIKETVGNAVGNKDICRAPASFIRPLALSIRPLVLVFPAAWHDYFPSLVNFL